MAKIERTKNATRNMFFGIILRTYQMLIPFFMRTVMIYTIGVQYLGLNSLFTSVLSVLNLAELGVGSAMVYSMYKPVAEDDELMICALMKMYRTYYRAIGLIIAIVGCLLTPFIPRLILKDIPIELDIYVLYLLNLGTVVLSYWLFAYKNSILQVYQRTDITSKITLVTSTVQYGLQFFALYVLKNYYIYIGIMLITQALTNIFTATYVNTLYPNFKPYGKLSKMEVKKINQRIKDLFTAKLGTVVVGAVDSIVISAFLGLTVLAVYQNYYYIMNAICGFIAVIFSSITAGIGNSLVTESNEKNYNDFRKFSFIICFILCICCCCFIGLYQPFMKLWVGSKLMLNFSFIVLFCILFYCLELAMVWATVKDAAGLWHSDRFRPLIGSVTNLILNIVLVQYIGLYGIIISTIVSYVFVSMPWLIRNLFVLLYKKPLWQYLKQIFIYMGITVMSCFFTYLICGFIEREDICGLLIRAVICISVPLAFQSILYLKKYEYIETIKLMKKMLRGFSNSIFNSSNLK